eukprot:TRINITY_DN50816_c0_g1_i1.p1 TRINITY_DN50816_c0_g1~~TRINITY_DN50816_c0_g1_i1.p1  ORF type:complete len:285 (-),score=42.77 TRINITY_DN50816_c0_g1_i1:15-869(-)
MQLFNEDVLGLILGFLAVEDTGNFRSTCSRFSAVTVRKVPPRQLHWMPYNTQKLKWPGGRNILAQHDEEAVVVYQAYNKTIAEFAVRHKRFAGCPGYGLTRMTWIKPQFLWMMYRSSWGRSHNQDHVLAIWLKRTAFLNYLRGAVNFDGKKEWKKASGLKGTMRLQWDPDHSPSGAKVANRRAVQLGLKACTSYIDGTDILDIQDISAQVAHNFQFVETEAAELVTPVETVLDVAFDPGLKEGLAISDLDSMIEERKQASEDKGKAAAGMNKKKRNFKGAKKKK